MRSSCAFRVTREWVSDTKWYGGTTRTVCATAAAAALCEHNRRPLPSMNYYLRGCPTGLEGQSVPGGHTCNIHPPPLVPREREKQKQFSHSIHKFVWMRINNNTINKHQHFSSTSWISPSIRFQSENQKNNSNLLIIAQLNSYISWCFPLKLRRLMVSCDIVLTQLTTRLKAKVCPEFLVGRDHLFLPF